MEKHVISTIETPDVRIEAQGGLTVKGWDEPQVAAKAVSAEDILIEQQGEIITIRCTSDCSVKLPRMASLRLEVVHGNAVCKALDGSLIIRTVHGNLDLRGVGPTTIEAVYGNLTVKNLSGDLKVGQVEGNVTAKDIQGSFMVESRIRGGLRLDDIDGNAQAGVDGNVLVHLDPSPGQTYEFSANGNLTCQVPEDTSAQVQITRAGRIATHFPGVSAPTSAPCSLTLGDGDAQLILSAAGNLLLAARSSDWGFVEDFDVEIGEEMEGMVESISDQITQQIDEQMRMVEEQLEAQMSMLNLRLGTIGMSEEQSRRVAERARQASERATARAQEKMRHAQERLERKLAAAQQRAEHRRRSVERAAQSSRRSYWGGVGVPAPAPEPPGEVISEEERLMILRMLEQKKISLEEAEQLLSALEGKES